MVKTISAQSTMIRYVKVLTMDWGEAADQQYEQQRSQGEPHSASRWSSDFSSGSKLWVLSRDSYLFMPVRALPLPLSPIGQLCHHFLKVPKYC